MFLKKLLLSFLFVSLAISANAKMFGKCGKIEARIVKLIENPPKKALEMYEDFEFKMEYLLETIQEEYYKNSRISFPMLGLYCENLYAISDPNLKRFEKMYKK